jgi:hypothetical protein
VVAESEGFTITAAQTQNACTLKMLLIVAHVDIAKHVVLNQLMIGLINSWKLYLTVTGNT